MRKLIVITFLLLGLLFGGIGVFFYLPTIVEGWNFGSADFRTIHLKRFDPSEEAVWMQSAEVLLPEKVERYVLIVPDRNTDRDWNSPGNEARTGLRFARKLVESNIGVIRYSPPGSGNDQINLTDPGLSRIALERVLRAFQAAKDTEAVENSDEVSGADRIPDAPLSVLSVGEGCIISLAALQQPEVMRISNIDSLYLAGCAYPETLLDGWIGRVYYNMELTGVSADLMDRAAQIWSERKKEIDEGSLKPMDKDAWEKRLEKLKEQGMPADLLAFEKTLSYLSRPDNIVWTRAAAHIRFQDLLTQLRESRPELRIVHVMGEYDEEIRPADREAMENYVRTSGIDNYEFRTLERMDHSFCIRESPPASPVENMMRRRDPFVDFSPEILKLLAGAE